MRWLRADPPGAGPPVAALPTQRACGECSLCCTVLRVDELAKLGGTPCRHLGAEGGCSIHPRRPQICRSYECLWLRGAFDANDRPDRLGAVLDLIQTGDGVSLAIREGVPGAFERSPRLQEIAAQYRETMPVRITNADDVMNPDKPFKILLGGGEEQRVEGDVVWIYRDGERVGVRRLSWLGRQLRRVALQLARWRLRRIHARGSKA